MRLDIVWEPPVSPSTQQRCHTHNLTTIDPTACNRTTVMATLTLPRLSLLVQQLIMLAFLHDAA